MQRSLLAALAAMTIALPFAAPLVAQATQPEINEYDVPWEGTRPRDPYVAPDGRVWFVGQGGNYLAVFDPARSAMERVEIDPGTHPHNAIVDAQGRVWYSGNRNGMIGRYDPATKQITRYPMPDSTVQDPHTMIFDGKGNIFFTAQSAGRAGRLNMSTGKIDLITVGRGSRPYGIIVDGSGAPWFTLFGTNKLARIDPATMQLREFSLPEGARPRRIAIGGDGRTIWYVDYARGFLGRLDPTSGEVKEFASPGGTNARPYAMTSDDRGRLWYVETGSRPNRMVAFDPTREEFVVNAAVGVEGQNTIRHMIYHQPTRSIWYGADANVIGKVSVPVTIGPVP
jgi:virginiamycin B lyase